MCDFRCYMTLQYLTDLNEKSRLVRKTTLQIARLKKKKKRLNYGEMIDNSCPTKYGNTQTGVQ